MLTVLLRYILSILQLQLDTSYHDFVLYYTCICMSPISCTGAPERIIDRCSTFLNDGGNVSVTVHVKSMLTCEHVRLFYS